MSDKSLPEPAIIVIFGITGDLVKRKLIPALINLINQNLLHPNTLIIGVTRQNISSEQLLKNISKNNPVYDSESLEIIRKRLIVQIMDITNGEDYRKLLSNLNQVEEDNGMCMNRLYYLSIPPQVFGPIVRFLGEHGLNKSCQHNIAETRLLVEKPFGYDLKSAHELIGETSKYFSESQIYRIDHYIAKETVQNILSFRFSNAIFESLWNHEHISRIDIVATESIGIEGRTLFYEQTGALRDLIQSHLIPLLSIIAMERPKTMSSDDIHKSRIELLKSIGTINPDKVTESAFRAQYETYQEEVGNGDSFTETFAVIKLFIDSSRWKGVPIIIKTGKALEKKDTHVKIIFKHVENDEINRNSLTLRIQPNEGIDLELCVKKPGLDNVLQRVDMDFSYKRFFENIVQTDAYERVLVDSIRGDHTLFATSAEVIEAWRIIEPIIENWSKLGDGLESYKNNSNGPKKLPEWILPGYNLI